MHISTILSSFVAVSALVTTGVHAQAILPAPAPAFEPLFIATFETGDVVSIKSPFGTRMYVGIPG